MNRLKELFRGHYYLFTSLFLFLSFPSYDFFLFKMFPVFAWFFLVPLLLFNRERSLRDIFFYSFITGLAGHFFTYGWIGNFGIKITGGYTVIVAFLIPSLTAFFVLKILCSEILSRKYPSLRFIIYPSIWIIGDFIQSIGFLAFPWTYIGYSQFPFTSFIQAASVIGILGINFIIIMFNVSVAEVADIYLSKKVKFDISDIIKRSELRRLASFFILVMLITAGGFLRISTFTKGSGPVMRFSIVQSCISPWDNWDGNRYRYLAELVKYTRDALPSKPDFIIWSESATLETISFRSITGENDLFDRQLFDFIRETGRPLLTGEIGVAIKPGAGRFRFYPQNNAVLIDGQGKVVQTYAKINLVPFGEWVPYEKWLTPVKRLASSMGGSDFVPGKNPELFTLNGLKFGSLVCYEGIFFRLCREYKRLGADFLVNITNDGWTDTYCGHFQHFSASIFRALENGIWVIRAGNTGASAIIDPAGRVTASMPILTKGHFTGDIDVSLNRTTIYEKTGDLVLYMSVTLIMLIIVINAFKARLNRGK